MVAGARNDFEKPGFSIGGKKDIYKSVVLANKVQKLLYEEGNYNKTKEAIKEVISKSKKYSYTKEEIEYAIAIVDGLHIVGRLDAPLSEDDGGEMTGYDEVKSNEDGYLDMERQELLNAFVENFEKKWKLFIAGRGKIDCQWFKVFLSRDILIVLKLEHLNKEERKKYKDLLEPKCTSWCSKRGACPYITYKDGKKITSRDSCYIRYEESTAASGDIELYEHLKKVGDIFYQSVLENTYVKKAYTEDVNNLDDLYRMKLKPRTSNTEVEEDIFLFTDTILGNAIGRDKKAVSVAKKKYEENRPMLFKFFESELFDDSGDT